MKLFVNYYHKSSHRYGGTPSYSGFASIIIDTKKYPILDENLEFELDEDIAEENWLEKMSDIVKKIHVEKYDYFDADISIMYYREAVYGTACKKTF